jgi:hypothetical protein
MSVTLTCDYCGAVITGAKIDLESDTHFSKGGVWRGGTLGNFHNTEECYGVIREAIRTLLDARAGLEAIPVLDEEPPVRISSPRGTTATATHAVGDAPASRTWTAEMSAEMDARIKATFQAVRAPGGLNELGLPHGIAYRLHDAEVLTVVEAERRHRAGTLEDIKGLGPSRLAFIAERLAWHSTATPDQIDEMRRGAWGA